VAAPEQQFQHALVRQIEQRQALDHTRSQVQASTQAKARAEAKAGAEVKTRDDAAQPEPLAASGNADQARPVRPESGPKADAKSDDGHLDLAPQPLSDMLTLVASLQQAAAASTSAPKAADAGPVTSTAARSATAPPDFDLDTKADSMAGSKADSKAALLPDAAPKAQALDLKPDLQLAAIPTPFVAPATLKTAAAPDAPLPGTVNLVAPTAQAALHIAQAASALPTDKLHGQVGSPAWDQQLGQKVVWMAAGGAQSATLTLNPPDLGPLQVVLNVANDQATISFTSAQPEVRQALEAAMPKLREMMGEAGVNLANASVSAGTSSQDQASTQQERLRHGGGAQPDSDSAQAMAMAIPMPAARGTALQGSVDTFA
jgi:flagellar hook-length control protein FliK